MFTSCDVCGGSGHLGRFIFRRKCPICKGTGKVSTLLDQLYKDLLRKNPLGPGPSQLDPLRRDRDGDGIPDWRDRFPHDPTRH
jgi:hypothetical protein